MADGNILSVKCTVIEAIEQTKTWTQNQTGVRKSRITDEMLDMMEERRKQKSERSEEGRININSNRLQG